MDCPTTFLIGAGDLPCECIKSSAIFLNESWGGTLLNYSCDDSPLLILRGLPETETFVSLTGDAATFHSEGSSWMEALADWRHPIILISKPSIKGKIPGTAYSYVSLCRYLGVPLLGIAQLGGVWDRRSRIADGLPWCGLIPLNNSNEQSDHHQAINDSTELVTILKSRFYSI